MKSFRQFRESDQPPGRKQVRLPGGVTFTVNDAKLFKRIVAAAKKDPKEGFVPGANKLEMNSILKMEKIGLVVVRRGNVVRGHDFKRYNWGRDFKMVDTEHVPMFVFPAENYQEIVNKILSY